MFDIGGPNFFRGHNVICVHMPFFTYMCKAE